MKHFNKSIGNLGEDLAENYLKNLGYIILDRNFKCKCGEVDIVVRDKDFICFVEVKTRYDLYFGRPAESVIYSKQYKIFKTAQVYILMKNLTNTNFRFDVVEVILNSTNDYFSLNHIKDAFQL